MKLYYAPGACSLGIHAILEEIGQPYDSQKLNLREGDSRKPEFLAVNPKGKVPTLQRDSGAILTEFPVIAHYLAKANPGANLLPKDDEAELAAASATDFVVATIHMQGFSRIFGPANFSPADHDAAKARGQELVEKGFAVMNEALEGKDYVAGTLSYADFALFYVEYWAAKRFGMQLPANLAAHFERMMGRPAIQRTLEQEGLAA